MRECFRQVVRLTEIGARPNVPRFVALNAAMQAATLPPTHSTCPAHWTMLKAKA
jgi:hypothetical protein